MAIWLPTLPGRVGPRYRQIVDAMADDIASGKLLPGDRLPPHRQLADLLGVSANTTSRAYAEAIRRALIRGEVGRGTFVRAIESPEPVGTANTLRRPQTGPVDLSRNLPCAGFAEPHLRRVLQSLSEARNVAPLLDFQIDTDLDPHIDAARLWLKTQQVEASVDEIVATLGAQHGLHCILGALLHRGDLLLTESLTYLPVTVIADRLGIHCRQVEMDAEGVLPESFEFHCRNARPTAFYLMPNLQVPTAITLPAGRRKAIAAIAERYGVLLIEDDVFGPLKVEPPAPLARYAPDHTLYVSSLSKAIAPGLRVGYLRAPRHLVAPLRQAVNLSVWMTPPLNLEIATRLIEDGTTTELAAQQRHLAEHRQMLAQDILKPHLTTTASEGLHAWLPLPNNLHADSFRVQCAAQGVLVNDARSFTQDASNTPEAIRLCLGHEQDDTRLVQGLQQIATLLRSPTEIHALDI